MQRPLSSGIAGLMERAVVSRKVACIAGFSLVLVLLIAVSFHFLYTSPSVGITPAWDKSLQRWKVASAEPWSAFREGDVIQRIGEVEIGHLHLLESFFYLKDRKEVLAWFEARRELYQKLQEGNVTFVVVRAEEEANLIIQPRRNSIAFLFSSKIIVLFSAFVYFAIGLIIFCKRGDPHRSLILFLACFLISATNIVHVTTISSEISLEPHFNFFLCVTQSLACYLGFVQMLSLSLLLPRRSILLERFPLLPWAACVPGILAIAALYIAVQHVVFTLLCILIVLATVHSYLACTTPVEKQQMKWVIAGYAFGLLPVMTLTAIPTALTGEVLVDVNYTGSFLVFLPLSMAFAIHRYRLMGIDDLLEGTFVYVATMGLLAGVDLALVNLLSSRFGNHLELHPTGRMVVALAITISLYATIRERVRLSLRRLFRREPLSEKALLADFTNAASGQPAESIPKLLEGLIRRTFNPRSLALLASGSGGELFSALKGRRDPVLLWQTPLKVGEALLALPLGKGEETEYVLLLGELPRGKFYGSLELGILTSLLRQAKLLYENACLFDENLKYCRAILEEERRHLSEKERILRDLHDGLGGIMTNINLLSALAQKAHDRTRPLATIAELSQEGLSEIRTFMHSLDSGSLSWEGFVSDLRALGSKMIEPNGLRFELESALSDGRAKPGSLLYLNLLRIYKEALTNVIKHSRAGRVRVGVEIGPERIALSVEDDGVGLKEGGRPGRGLASMKARAMDIGGDLVVLSGSGTRVCFELGRQEA